MNHVNPYLLETANAVIFAISAGMTFIVARYLLREVITHGYTRYRSRAAVSLLTIFTGEMCKAGILWWVRSEANDGLPPGWISLNQDYVVFVGAILLTLGGLCFIRIYSPAEGSEWPWVGTAIVGATFAFAGWMPALFVLLFLGLAFFFSRRPIP